MVAQSPRAASRSSARTEARRTRRAGRRRRCPRHRARDRARRELAVLARAKSVLTGIEAALVAAQIPYRVLSGTAFYQRREVKAGARASTLLVNPHDAEAFRASCSTPAAGSARSPPRASTPTPSRRSISLLEACVRADHLSRVRPRPEGDTDRLRPRHARAPGQLERRSVSSLLADVVRLPDGLGRHPRRPGRRRRAACARLRDLVAAARAYERDAAAPERGRLPRPRRPGQRRRRRRARRARSA